MNRQCRNANSYTLILKSSHRGPLSRYRVVDLTRVRSGPTCVRQLADWGADVIKVEAPAGSDVDEGWASARHGSDFQNLHRNKLSITINLKKPDGLAIFRKLPVIGQVRNGSKCLKRPAYPAALYTL